MENNLPIESLPRDARDFFEERAAIFEFDAGLDKLTAEKYALAETAKIFSLQQLQLINNGKNDMSETNNNLNPVEISPYARKALEETVTLRKLNIAQDFIDGILYYGIKLNEKSLLISSKREFFSVEEAMEKRFKLIDIEVEKSRFSVSGIKSFLSGDEVNLYKLFNGIRSYIKSYIILPSDSLYDLLALWVMGTYVFRIFRYFPYIHLLAEKGSGKTLLMEILSPVCFNGEISVSNTTAVIFREVQALSPTLFIDEAEKLYRRSSEANTAMLEILRGGYNISGTVKRCDKESHKVKSYSCYSPKMFASISDIEDVLGDRAIKIRILRKTESESVDNYMETQSVLQTHEKIRTSLYNFGLNFAPTIFERFSQFNLEDENYRHLRNREMNLWCPLLILSSMVDDYSENSSDNITSNNLIQLSKAVVAEKQYEDFTENQTVVVSKTILIMLNDIQPTKTEDSSFLYDTDATYSYFIEQEGFDYLTSKTHFSRILNKTCKIKTKPYDGNKKSKRAYVINKEEIEDVLSRYSKRDLEE